MKSLLGYFNAKVGERVFSNQQLGMRLHQGGNDNGVRIVNSDT